jgi:hypothetical protein
MFQKGRESYDLRFGVLVEEIPVQPIEANYSIYAAVEALI